MPMTAPPPNEELRLRVKVARCYYEDGLNQLISVLVTDLATAEKLLEGR